MAQTVAVPIEGTLVQAVLGECGHCRRTIYALESDMPLVWRHWATHHTYCPRPAPGFEDDGSGEDG